MANIFKFITKGTVLANGHGKTAFDVHIYTRIYTYIYHFPLL